MSEASPLAPAPAPPPANPLSLLRQVESGDVHITVPAIPGTHDSGLSKYTIRPGTQISISLKVRDGELVPGFTRITFSPKLDNFAWAELGAIELLADGRIMGRVDGWRDKDLTRKFFDIPKLPLEMTALFDMLTKPSKTGGTSEPTLVDMSKLQLALTDCVLAPGKLPLLDKSVELSIGGAPAKKQLLARQALHAAEIGKLDALGTLLASIDPKTLSPEEENTLLEQVLPRAIALAKEADERHLLWLIALILSGVGLLVLGYDALTESTEERAARLAGALRSRLKPRAVTAPKNRTVVDITADMHGLRMTGDFVFSRVRVDRKDVAVDAGETRGKGTLTLSLDENSAALDLRDMAMTARSVAVNDVAGSSVAAKNITASGGRLALDFNFENESLNAPVELSLPNATLDIDEASLAVGLDAPVVLGRGHAKGNLTVTPTGLSVELDDADLAASMAKLEAGEGSFKLGYTAASVRGKGGLRYNDGIVDFSGALAFSGTIDDAKIGKPGGALYIDVASGAQVDLALTKLRIGKGVAQTEVSGKVDLALDGGEIMLATGSRMKLARGSKAHIDIHEARLDDEGASMRAAVTLDAAVSAPVSGRTKVTLDEVTLSPDGKLAIDGVRSTIDLRVTRISGKITPRPLPARPAVTAPKTKPVTSTKKTDPLGDMLKAVKDGVVVVKFPLPAGDYGTGDVLTIKRGTIATLTVTVENGRVVFGKTSLSTSRELDLPGPFNSSGLYVNDDGDLVASIDYMKDVNLHWFKDDFRIGKTLTDVFAQVSTLSGGSGGAGGGGGGSSISLTALSLLGVSAEVKDVTFNDTVINVDGDTALRFDAGTRVSLTVKNGAAKLSGVAVLDRTRIAAQGAEIVGLSGRTDIDVTVTDRHTTAKVALDNLAADEVRFGTFAVKAPRLSGQIDVKDKVMSAKLTHVTGAIEGTIAGAEVSADRFTGAITADGKGARGSLVVENATMRMKDMNVDAAGLVSHGSASGKATGVLTFDTRSQASFAGSITLAAELDSGAFAGGPLKLDLQTGTRAALTLSTLSLGKAQAFSGSAELDIAVAGGTLKLPNALTLDIADGSNAKLTLTEINQERARGKLHLRATTKMKLPRGGLVLPGAVRLTEVKGHRGVVDVTIDDISVDKTGAYSLSDVRVKIDLKMARMRAQPR